VALNPKQKGLVRQQALRQMCYGPDGGLTKNARLIAAYLRKECNGDGREGPPLVRETGQIDPVAMGVQLGRRQVFDILARMLNLDLETIHNLKEDL
jgi:hypothetical protein